MQPEFLEIEDVLQIHPEARLPREGGMLACTPERIGRSDMPDVLADFDLSPDGEPWKRWMAVIDQLRQQPRWRRIAVSAECAGLSLMINACALVAKRSGR
jgi:hypothetical protein